MIIFSVCCSLVARESREHQVTRFVTMTVFANKELLSLVKGSSGVCMDFKRMTRYRLIGGLNFKKKEGAA